MDLDASVTAIAGPSPLNDLARAFEAQPASIVVDVGANVGQSVHWLRQLCPAAQIHCFEPLPSAFELLEREVGDTPSVFLSRAAVGATDGQSLMYENSVSDMSSQLALGPMSWGRPIRQLTVDLITLDSYCARVGIDRIDLLKIDTQGAEMSVLRGATELINTARVRIIQLEMIFVHMYDGASQPGDILKHMAAHRYELLGFYNAYSLRGRLGWCDALFRAPASVDGGREQPFVS